ncbi:MAG: nickel-dependent hydrogenase large subunit [Desulfovibrionaceae bacterium]|jgi:Ni,Fe-hydrogenase I large subunit|nr:nickel-dependent hydrogenase large subunit [Desulfovibrionaceae bacterium]
MMQVDKAHPAPTPAAGGPDQGAPRREIPCPGNTFVIGVRLVDGRVDEAWSTGRMLRNMNVLLRGGLDEQGNPRFAQQAHCLCNDGHALAAVRAVEDLAGVAVPRGALLVRSLVQALRCIQEQLLHVYQFHLSDWACLDAALRADPARAARLAAAGAPGGATGGAESLRSVQARLQTLVREQGAQAIGGGAGPHPDRHGPDELHLLLHAHGLEALQAGAAINAALALLDCGPQGFAAYSLGGLPEGMDLGARVRDQVRVHVLRCREFVARALLPDLERLARAHAHWAEIGRGGSFLSWGDYAHPAGEGTLFPGGVAAPAPDGPGRAAGAGNAAGWNVRAADGPIREEREPRWSPGERDRYRLRPDATGLEFRWGQGDFAWLSAPRLGATPCEAGPLARLMGAWALGREPVHEILQASLENCGLAPAAMNSTLGRLLARGVEAAVLARAALDWLDELERTLRGGAPLRTEVRLPSSGLGLGRVEVPRGALLHSVRMEDGRIADHDYLIPSLWNFSPRDAQGVRGPLEQALLGTAVADPGHPLEVLRTVHAFDPCNGCHLVVEDTNTGRTILVDAT